MRERERERERERTSDWGERGGGWFDDSVAMKTLKGFYFFGGDGGVQDSV